MAAVVGVPLLGTAVAAAVPIVDEAIVVAGAVAVDAVALVATVVAVAPQAASNGTATEASPIPARKRRRVCCPIISLQVPLFMMHTGR
ncbi:MAG TPA: hypothetical protein VIU62_09275 [Chloroflexota bacterium]